MSERELAVSKVPVLTGTFLGLQEGNHFTALARFASEEAAEVFLAWARENDGKPLSFSSDSSKSNTERAAEYAKETRRRRSEKP